MKLILQNRVIIGLLMLGGAGLWYATTSTWDYRNLSMAALGAVSLITGLIANYKQIKLSFGKRSTKYLTNYVVSVVLVLALISALNFIGQRHSARLDLTATSQFTLAPQSIQILGKLTSDLDIKVFFPGGDYPPMKELLSMYRGVNHRVHFEFIDPNKNPSIAKQYNVTVYKTYRNMMTGATLKTGTVIVSYNGRQEKIEKQGEEEVGEEDLTNAVIKVERIETKTIYFVQGHGEKDPANTDRGGYSEAKQGLEKEGFKVATLTLASEAKVPADAKVLIEAGPKVEPFSRELDYLSNYLNQGGALLVLVDPTPAASLAAFLKDWQVTPDNDIILDVASRLMGADYDVPLVFQYESHPITDRFKEMTVFPYTRSIEPSKDAIGGVTVTPLFKSSANSWGETDLKNKNASYDQKTDLKGPLPIAVAVTKEVKPAADNNAAVKARMVVAGNSDFAANIYFGTQGNGNLFLNMASWLAQEEDLISIRPKAAADRKVIMSQSQQTMLQLLTLVFVPGAALVAGIIVWTRRRK